MDLIADALLIAGAFAAGLYCWVLSKRLKGLEDMDAGVGGAIASLNEQVGEMKVALKATQSVTGTSVNTLQSTTKKAEKVARRLEDYLSELDTIGVTTNAPQVEVAQHEVGNAVQTGKTAPKLSGDDGPAQQDGAVDGPKTPAVSKVADAVQDTEIIDDLSKSSDLEVDSKADQTDRPAPQESSVAVAKKRAKQVDVRLPRKQTVEKNPQLGQRADALEDKKVVGSVQNHENEIAEKAQLIASSGLSAAQIKEDEALIRNLNSDPESNVRELAKRRAEKNASISPLASEPQPSSASGRLKTSIKKRIETRHQASPEDEFVKALQTVLASTKK